MKIVLISSIAVMAALLAGCTTSRPAQDAAKPKVTVPFDEAALQPYLRTGTSTIVGQAFLKTSGGEVKYGAGDEVSLIPVTAFTTALLKGYVGPQSSSLIEVVAPRNDARLHKYIRTVLADGSGNFEFQNIPAGDYYIVCPIFWSVPDFELGTTDETGGVALAKTQVDNGQSVKVVVTLQ